jgi:hypothetical protein
MAEYPSWRAALAVALGLVLSSCRSPTERRPASPPAPRATTSANTERIEDGRQRCWRQQAAPPHGIRRLWASAKDDVWAVGFTTTGGAVHRWNGTEWRTVHRTQVGIVSIWGSAGNDVWIGGGRGTMIHWDGERFSEFRTAQTGLVLWGSGPNDVWASGPPQTLLHFRGSDWEEVTLSEPVPDDPRLQFRIGAVWGTSERDIWAAGSHGTLLHFDGSGWRRVDSGTTEGLGALWGVGPNDVWAAGDFGIVLHFDGARWSTVGFPPTRGCRALWGSGPDDVWASTDEAVFRWDGRGWSTVGGLQKANIWGLSATQVWVAQEKSFLELGGRCDDVSSQAANPPFTLTAATPERRVPDTSGEDPPTENEARRFVADLRAVAKTGDLERWKSMLSWKQRVKSVLELQLPSWRAALVSAEDALPRASFVTSRSGGRALLHFSVADKSVLIMHVTREDGELRLDEN